MIIGTRCKSFLVKLALCLSLKRQKSFMPEIKTQLRKKKKETWKIFSIILFVYLKDIRFLDIFPSSTSCEQYQTHFPQSMLNVMNEILQPKLESYLILNDNQSHVSQSKTDFKIGLPKNFFEWVDNVINFYFNSFKHHNVLLNNI